MSKQVRKSFPSKANNCAKMGLELVHGDLCGPISPTTSGENKYFLLLVDDFNRMMWVYMLKTNNEAPKMLKKFKAQVEKATDKQVRIFRTDRGGEFCSHEFAAYCEDNGIERHYTAPYSPQQNGLLRTEIEPLLLWPGVS